MSTYDFTEFLENIVDSRAVTPSAISLSSSYYFAYSFMEILAEYVKRPLYTNANFNTLFSPTLETLRGGLIFINADEMQEYQPLVSTLKEDTLVCVWSSSVARLKDLSVLSIELPKKCSFTQYTLFAKLVGIASGAKLVGPSFFQKYYQTNWDIVLKLLWYDRLLKSVYKDEFLHAWSAAISDDQYISLYDLPTAFWAGNKSDFLDAVERLEPLYPSEFWLSFWSDQLWYGMMALQSSYEVLPQKKVLPFSFKDFIHYQDIQILQKKYVRYIGYVTHARAHQSPITTNMFVLTLL